MAHFDDTDHGLEVDTTSTVSPPGQDPDIPVEHENLGADDGTFRTEPATEQDELDQLDPEYREVD